jgi:hypothetical protein
MAKIVKIPGAFYCSAQIRKRPPPEEVDVDWEPESLHCNKICHIQPGVDNNLYHWCPKHGAIQKMVCLRNEAS